MNAHHDLHFRCMGTDCRVLVGHAPEDAGRAARAAESAADVLRAADAALSRFRPDSDLSRLNADPRPEVPASALLLAAVAAGRRAAEATGGLVDPTLTGALERAGYAESREGSVPDGPLAVALAAAPVRRPARPSAAAAWQAVEVDAAAGTVRRPPGVRLDTGGTGKGLAADLAAERLAGEAWGVVDCGGDIRHVGSEPLDVAVQHPLTGEPACTIRIPANGAVATSGIDARLWRRADGTWAHHLLDPSTGAPAWTGVVAATALARTAAEAEALAKAALLSGPLRGRRVLRDFGGVLVRDDGSVDVVDPRPVVVVPLPRTEVPA